MSTRKDIRYLITYRQIEILLAFGEAIELQHGQIHFSDRPYMDFLITLDSYELIRELMTLNSEEAINIVTYNPSTLSRYPSSSTFVRSDRIGSISGYTDGRWFLVDEDVFHFSQRRGETKSNVINDDALPRRPTIGEMQAGDEGYTAPWAYDAESRVLDEKCDLALIPGGAFKMLVVCIEGGVYEIDFSAVRRYETLGLKSRPALSFAERVKGFFR